MAPQSPVDEGSPGTVPLEEVKRLALALPSPRASLDTLRGGRVAVIAELDPARADRHELAEQYERSGVGAVAVPAGDPATLAEFSACSEAPVLSLEPAASGYQLWQARAHGADLVLIVAAQLPDDALVCLVERASTIGLAALVEVRDGRDLVRALRAGARALLLRAPADAAPEQARLMLEDLLPMVPDHVVRIAECGAARADLIACARLGADAVLLGRALLAGPGAAATVSGMASMGAHPALARRR
jgi:indole-3-glycerol phosphate synthase